MKKIVFADNWENAIKLGMISEYENYMPEFGPCVFISIDSFCGEDDILPRSEKDLLLETRKVLEMVDVELGIGV